MADQRLRNKKNFPSAAEDEQVARELTQHYPAQAYRLAYADMDFLKREELRPVRLQLELLKPELMQQEHNIDATVVVFGSARFLPRNEAEDQVVAARNLLAADPDNPAHQQLLAKAQRQLKNSHYYEQSRDLGRLIAEYSASAEEPIVVVTGGGPGIMEAANRGSLETGGKSIGLNIVLPHEQKPNDFITPELCFQFHYFAIRKMHFLLRAKALVLFPGGFGTLDELFETLTLIQTGKSDRVPVLLFDRDFWTRLINFDLMVEEGTISTSDLDLFQYVETADEAWAAIKDFYQL